MRGLAPSITRAQSRGSGTLLADVVGVTDALAKVVSFEIE